MTSPPGPLIVFSYCAKSTNHNWYNRHFHVPQLFQFSSKVEVLILLFTFFQFYSVTGHCNQSFFVYSYTFCAFFTLLFAEGFSQDVTIPPRPPEYINFFETISILAGDHLVVSIGYRTFLSGTRNTIKGVGEKNKEQTNNMAWVSSTCKKRSYVTLHSQCISRLMLA